MTGGPSPLLLVPTFFSPGPLLVWGTFFLQFPPPMIRFGFPDQMLSLAEDLIMDNARQAAAAGFIRSESIPLLALTDESFYHGKLSWTLRFPVPPPDTSGSARRFSSTVTFQQGPHSAEALDSQRTNI